MNRRNPRKSSVRKKLRELRDKGTVVSSYPETVSVGVVASDEFDPDEDASPADRDDEDDEERVEAAGLVKTNLGTGERTVYDSDGEVLDVHSTDRPECSEDGCSNPRFSNLGTCEKCAGMPEQDWREGVE